MRRGRTAWLGGSLLAGALTLATAMPATAADLGAIPDLGATPGIEVPTSGVPCEAPIVQTFPSVWEGHFKGGYSHYLGEGGPIVLDWRSEKLCFPTQGSCNQYVREMRSDFHRPEGDFTCLPLR